MIIGNGGHARVIASLLPAGTATFLVLGTPGPGELAQDAVLSAPLPADADFYIGIGNDAVRRSYFDRLTALDASLPPVVASNAWVARDARLGRGVFIGPGAIVAAGARLGDNCIVNTLASVDHDCDVGEDSQLTPGVTLASHIRTGRGCYFGMKSGVLPRLTLGEEVRVMAGSLVVRDVPDRVMVGGTPARIIPSGEKPAA